MTEAQWRFEAIGLRKKEDREAKLIGTVANAMLRALRLVLIETLGLNLVPEKEGEKKNDDEDATPNFIPLSLLTGQPEVIQKYLEDFDRLASDDAKQSNVAFESFSSALHDSLKGEKNDLDEGDLVPLLTEELDAIKQRSSHYSDAAMEQLAAMGIKIRTASGEVPHLEVPEGRLREGGYIDEALLRQEIEDAGKMKRERARFFSAMKEDDERG
jgi:hypothetical protein